MSGTKITVVSLLIAGGVAFPSQSWAQVALKIEGPSAGSVSQKLQAKLDVISPSEFTRALREEGIPGRMPPGPAGPRLKDAARQAGASVVVLGRTTEARGRIVLKWSASDVNGGVLARGNDVVATARKKGRKRKVVWNVSGAIRGMRRAVGSDSDSDAMASDSDFQSDAESDAAPVSTASSSSGADPFTNMPDWSGGSSSSDLLSSSGDSAAADDGTPSVRKSRRSRKGDSRLAGTIFHISARAGVAGRKVTHKTPRTSNIRPYQLGAAPQIHVDGTVFPMSFLKDVAFVQSLGLQFTYEQALSISTETSDAQAAFDNTWREWRVGLVKRFNFSPMALDLSAAYGAEVFSFSGEAAAIENDAVPDVNYQYLRIGLDSQFELSRLTLGLGFAYRSVFSAGRMTSDFFPNGKAQGIDAGLTLGVRLVAGLELTAAGGYQHYFFKLNPEPGDTYAADGAADQMYSGQLGFRYSL